MIIIIMIIIMIIIIIIITTNMNEEWIVSRYPGAMSVIRLH